MGRAWKIKDDRIWWTSPWKAWEGISQKDEECSRYHWLTWRLQTQLYQEAQGRATWRWTHQETSRRRIGKRKA